MFNAAWHPGASLFTNQWDLIKITLCNWGPFQDIVSIPIAGGVVGDRPYVTFLTGRGASGKTCAMDAMTALLMPPNKVFSFNKASTRESEDQRKLRDYIRGRVQEVDDGPDYLRHGSIVTSVGATYRSSNGEEFSIARFFWMPSAETSTEVKKFFVTSYGVVEPSFINAYSRDGLDKAALRKAFPDASLHDTASAFMRCVCDTLGIPNEFGESNALELLHNIQSAEKIGRVDSLYKKLVLDEPSTFGFAEEALRAYKEHYRTYTNLQHYETLFKTLDGMRAEHDSYTEAKEAASVANSLFDGAPTSLELFCAQKTVDGLGRITDKARSEVATAQQSYMDADAKAETAKQSYDDIVRRVAEAGGDRVDSLRSELSQKEKLKDARQHARRGLEESARKIGEDTPNSASEFDAVRERTADRFVRLSVGEEDRRVEKEELSKSLAASDARAESIEADIEYYKHRKTRVRSGLARARDALAEGAGLEPEDLPFLAEVVDVARGYEDWRLAINLALKDVYNIVLMSSSDADEVRRKNNERPLGERLNLEEVDVADLSARRPMPDAWVSSRLVFNESSIFAPWVKRRVTGTNVDYECVDDVELLNRDDSPRITITGQTRRGSKGAIGHKDPREENVIGFANETLVEDLESELEDERARRRDIVARLRDIKKADELQAFLRDFQAAYGTGSYDMYDAAGVEKEIHIIARQIEEIETGGLAELLKKRDELDQLRSIAERAVGAAETARDNAVEVLNVLDPLLHAAVEQSARLFDKGARITVEQQALCNHEYEYLMGIRSIATSAKDLENEIEAFKRRISKFRSEKEAAVEQYRQMITKRFIAYETAAGEDRLEVSNEIESYADYDAQLTKLEQSVGEGNAVLMKQAMVESCNAALAPLQESYRVECNKIKARVEPINKILDVLDFGEDKGRLKVWCKDVSPVGIIDFRRRIDSFAEAARSIGKAGGEGDKALALLTSIMSEIEAALGRPDGSILDPRSLIDIKMRAAWPEETGRGDTIYEKLGSGSGSETKELAAFIYGSALLYYLGDELQRMPSFRTVMLDEAFIESDPNFTIRSIRALNGFGFQLVLAVPLEKVLSVASASDNGVVIVKDGNISTVSAQAWREYSG